MVRMIQQVLAQLPIFKDLSPEQLDTLAPLIQPCSFEKDAVIFEQGDPTRYLYIVIKGEVSIHYKPYDSTESVVMRIQPGGVFGWSAALGRLSYTSTAVSVEACNVYCLSGNDLRRLCEKYPDTGKILLEQLANVVAEHRITHEPVVSMLASARARDEENLRRQKDHGNQ